MGRFGIGIMLAAAVLLSSGVASAGVPSVVQEAMDLAAGRLPEGVTPHVATSGYSVVMESAEVDTGGTCEIGLFISNEEPARYYVIPLIIRKVSGGAYMTHLEAWYNGNSRLNGYLNGIHDTTLYLPPIINTYPAMSGYDSHGNPAFHAPGPLDYKSPDGLLFARAALQAGNELPSGSDGEPGSGTQSITIRMTVNYAPGTFEIDTTCIAPSNHLIIITGTVGVPGEAVALAPTFTKSIITVKGGKPTVADMPDSSTTDEPLAETEPVIVEDTVDTEVSSPDDSTPPDPFDEPADVVATKARDSQRGVTNAKPQRDARATNTSGATTTTLAPRRSIYNYPNPFNAETVIRYTVSEPSWVVITVHDLLGRTVTTLQDWYQSPGEYEVVWDGRDKGGNQVPSGMYFYRSKMRGQATAGKMVLLK